MTLTELIANLEAVRAEHGGEVPVVCLDGQGGYNTEPRPELEDLAWLYNEADDYSPAMHVILR